MGSWASPPRPEHQYPSPILPSSMTTETQIKDSELSRRLADRAEEFATKILGNPTSRSKREVRFFKKGGLVVYVSGHRKGKYVNHGAGTYGDMIDLYREFRGGSKQDAREAAKAFLGIVDGAPLPELPKIDQEKILAEIKAEEEKRRRTARWLWGRTQPITGTPGEAYLRRRGITFQLPDCIRYRAYSAHDLEKMEIDPARFPNGLGGVVFHATSPSGETWAVQQIILDGDRKADVENVKRTNGTMEGAAVKLGIPNEVLVLAEGPETGCSVHQSTGLPTWVVLGTSNLCRVEIPSTVLTIIIAVDMEPTGNGLAAALRAAAHWQKKGYEVRLALPARTDGDFNDIHQEDGETAVALSFEEAIVPDEIPADYRRHFVTRSPFDALALWRATGLPSIATIKDVRDVYFPDDAGEIVIVLGPDEALPEIDRRWLQEGAPKLFVLRLGRSLAHTAAVDGHDAVRRLVGFASQVDKRSLYGLESLARTDSETVVVCQSRRAADAAVEIFGFGALAHAAGPGETELYDWSPVRGRTVVIAPAHRPEGHAQAAAAAAAAHAAGAKAIKILDWPIIAPGPSGFEIRHRRLPEGYDMAMAREDGWSRATGEELLAFAVPLG